MKTSRNATLLFFWAITSITVALGEDYPFPAIEKVPERKLIKADQHGHPRIVDKDKAKVALLAASDHTPEHLRFYSIWGLAVSGFSPESSSALAEALTDRKLSHATRGYAAMGLRNFTNKIPAQTKKSLRSKLRATIEVELAKTPDEIIRTLIAWGDAPWIAERLADDLLGHPMEIEVLRRLPSEKAIPRLLGIYRHTKNQHHRKNYNRRSNIGRALIDFKDKQGIDILETLLDAQAVPKHHGEPNHQYRHNVFVVVTKAVGQDFGYKHRSYHPSIDTAILRFRTWWRKHRNEFNFVKAGSK